MSKKCQNCGAEMSDDMKFCPQCHKKFESVMAGSFVTTGNPEVSGNDLSQAPKVQLSFWAKMWQKRMTRKDFWTWQLISAVAAAGSGFVPGVGQIVSGVIGVYCFIIEWSRLHDAGKSAWNLLWYLVPIVGWIILIVLYCQPSEKGENAWGPEPQRMFGE